MNEAQLDNVLLNKGYDEETLQNMTEQEKENAALSDVDLRYDEAAIRQYSKAENAKEYPEEDSKKSYQELLIFFETYQFDYVVSSVSEVLAKYNLTNEQNIKLSHLQNDAIIMSTYEELDWEKKEQTLKMFRNPESFVLGVINAYPRRREAVILDINSYNPMTASDAHITGTVLLDKDSEEFEKNSGYLSDTRNIYRVDFSYGEFESMYAYVVETNSRTLRIIGFYTDFEYEYLRTVTWWMERGVDREKGA